MKFLFSFLQATAVVPLPTKLCFCLYVVLLYVLPYVLLLLHPLHPYSSTVVEAESTTNTRAQKPTFLLCMTQYDELFSFAVKE